MSSFRFVATAAFLAAIATLTGTGCGPDEDTRLFDETGVWALERHSLDGGPYTDISQNRKNRFLLRFSPGDQVVAAAACYEQGTTVNVNSSNCTNAPLSTWSCQCFSYTYANDRMVWQEFTPGDTPPPVGAPSGDGDTEGGGSGAHELFVAAVTGASSTYEFNSLPAGLFGSDGVASRHVFQIKADSIWTNVDVNGDGTNDLEACAMSCFPSEAP
jgi:hypothetical protein